MNTLEVVWKTQDTVSLIVIASAIIIYKLYEPQRKKKELEIKERQQEELNRVAKKAANIKADLYKVEAEFEVAVNNNSRANDLKSKIQQCKKLKEKGIINEEEYNNRFNEIVRQEKYLFDKYATPSVVAEVLYRNDVISLEDYEFTKKRESVSKEMLDEQWNKNKLDDIDL